MQIPFVKYEALGNDFVIIDAQSDEKLFQDLAPHASSICDRRRGVGADGVLFLERGSQAEYMMRLINADGSEAEMCGNGLRCIAHYLYTIGKLTNSIAIDTITSQESIEITLDASQPDNLLFRVKMFNPVLLPSLIPTTLGKETAIEVPLDTPNGEMLLTCVSMGNPHAVVFMDDKDDVEDLDLEVLGSAIENHSAFPRRTNVEFVKMLDRNTARVRVWERGCGETMACGSGACAVAVASVLTGRGASRMEIILNGGSLIIEWAGGDSSVFMTGTAKRVFVGEIDVNAQ